MAKVANPRYLYRLYTQKLDEVTLEPKGEKSAYFKSIFMHAFVFEWLSLEEKGFDHLEIHVEKRQGDKWVEISQLWGCFIDPVDVLNAHLVELELMEYHLKWCKEEDFE